LLTIAQFCENSLNTVNFHVVLEETEIFLPNLAKLSEKFHYILPPFGWLVWFDALLWGTKVMAQ
jgi:hypothetical protein